MPKQQSQPLVTAFSGRPPNAAMIALAHEISGGVSRDNVAKVMMGARAHHVANARLPNPSVMTARPTTSAAKSISPRTGSPSILSSIFSLGGSRVLSGTGYQRAMPRVSYAAPAPSPKAFGMAA